MTNLFTNKYFKIFLFLLSFLFLILNFVDYNINEDNSLKIPKERFDVSLVQLNNLSKLEKYIDSLTEANNIEKGSLDYAIAAKNVITYRFYHKYATQNLSENWIASFAQKITGLYLSSKITADDILTRPYGYCGQQNTVLMELFQKKNQDCRVIYLPKHFVIQTNINGEWYFFDANGEPELSKNVRSNLNWLKNKDNLAKAYNKDASWINSTFGDPVKFTYGKVNEVQGRNAQIFQSITKWLSKIAFIFPLLLYFYLNRKKKLHIAANYQK